MRDLERFAAIDDLRRHARRRMPRFAFDWLEGGAESDANVRRNIRSFEDIPLVPRYLRKTDEITTETSLFETRYAVPFGVAPIGHMNIAWPDSDVMMARLAARQNIPVVASTAGSTSLETYAEIAGENAWFQLYVSPVEDLTNMLLDRAEAAGMKVLVVTVDVSAPAKRDRDIRNGLRIPFQMTPSIFLDLAMHPRWSLTTLRAGAPGFGNHEEYWESAKTPFTVAERQAMLISRTFLWDDFKRIRERWKGKVLVKGLLHPDDAAEAVACGCDGIIVSNHGGRQADFAPSSIEALPAIAAVVGGSVPVMLDSGIRRGADIVRAKALGADFVFAGRAFAFGTAAAGEAGGQKAFDILSLELRTTLGQVGCADFADVDSSVLWSAGSV